MLQGRLRPSRVVDAEDDRARALTCKVPHLRIVAVDDERSRRIQVTDGTPPALRHVLQLAVTVELVAKEVAEAESAWP